MRRLLPLAVALLVVAPAAARAAESSSNVERVANIPELVGAISLNFIGDTMFVSTVSGVFSYDVSDPATPRPLGSLPMNIWENEDMDVDPVRKRVFVSRDPRGFTVPLAPGNFPYGGVHVIDVSDPRNLRQVGFFTLPAGHTSTCINNCDFLWTGGPIPGVGQPADWKGRPIFATDVRDPANPKPCPDPIDTARNDGVTDYAHDVQVDAAGVAWVSGGGGVRGYWTSGAHRNPLSGQVETATACKPVPYAGSGTPEAATPSRFMHNSFRDPTQAQSGPRRRTAIRCRRPRRARVFRRCTNRPRELPFGRATGQLPPERVLYGTEEALSSNCATSGRFVTYDLAGTFDGEGFKDIAKTKHRMRVLDTWTPEGQEGGTGCDSAHYFAPRGDGVFANAFYGAGLRFLDVSNPLAIRQIGWYRPEGEASAFAPYWHAGLVYLTDTFRGVDVLRFTGGPGSRSRRVPAAAAAAGAGAEARPRMSPDFGYMCPVPPRGSGRTAAG